MKTLESFALLSVLKRNSFFGLATANLEILDDGCQGTHRNVVTLEAGSWSTVVMVIDYPLIALSLFSDEDGGK